MAFQDRDVSALGVGEFCHFIGLDDHDFPESVLDAFRDNGINGSVFLHLSTQELKELAPRIANRVALRQIVGGEDVNSVMQCMHNAPINVMLHLSPVGIRWGRVGI